MLAIGTRVRLRRWWDSIDESLAVVLLSKVGWAVIGCLAVIGFTLSPSTIREWAGDALTPLAVILGFGLTRMYGMVRVIAERRSVSKEVGAGFLPGVLVSVGSVGSVGVVLLYRLLPEVTFPESVRVALVEAGADNLLRIETYLNQLLAATVVVWVGISLILLLRCPFLAADADRLVALIERPSSKAYWKRRWGARRLDMLTVALLIVVGASILASRGVSLPDGGQLLYAAGWGLAYEVVCALFFRGWTLGKWRKRVTIGTGGSLPSRKQAALRAVALYTPILLWGVARLDAVLGTTATLVGALAMTAIYGLMMLHPDGVGFHDLAARTVVTVSSNGAVDTSQGQEERT